MRRKLSIDEIEQAVKKKIAQIENERDEMLFFRGRLVPVTLFVENINGSRKQECHAQVVQGQRTQQLKVAATEHGKIHHKKTENEQQVFQDVFGLTVHLFRILFFTRFPTISFSFFVKPIR